ncbi:class I SAM-dependent methyltransferase [Virgibacillus sp. 179-BFC.A HS]|uniref:Class I SAM-dependent methyltransferase n=1 Tax=Tigheibacillus jepli TaxID=3035914 RepID=A0ABU5CGC2_9BACI|nr:class I SAM-dependent methyltransferase [Virgibacillus sp. 179-BFC.A HS]MDY0405331.1 class I SAM-dependent methyltransferase [Virgibacillus sp. 179-BFC.A HS]
MEKTNMEKLYDWLNHAAQIIGSQDDAPYLDNLATAINVLFYQDTDGIDNDIARKKLQTILNKVTIDHYDKTDVSKAIHLAILNGMKQSTQQQHLMTPDTVSLLIGYLANKLMADKENVRLFDPVCGTGSLLMTVMDQLRMPVEAYASEVDPTLIQLASGSANLLEKEIEFFHQDSLRPFLLDPVDLVVGDLPVGYYPDDVTAAAYKLKSDQGHSYAHHLLMEQSIHYTRDEGYLLFVIPNFLFESDQADKLRKFFLENVHIIGLLQLPDTAFKSKSNAKSILILQKKSNQSKDPKQPLLVNLPSFKNAKAMEDITVQMNAWFNRYLQR